MYEKKICIFVSDKTGMKKFKDIWLKVKPILNKYVISVLVIFVFVVFIDENSVVKRVKLEREISSLKKEIKYYQKLRDSSEKKLDNINSGKDELERIAREDYLMKKADEDIYLIK
jgi:cell division protein FtsB